jgi:6-phosphogluconolactonase
MKHCLRWFLTALAAAVPLSAAPMLVFIGTYTDTTSRGIYALRLDPALGTLSAPWLAGEALNPTFLALDPGHSHLYATGQLRLDPAPPSPLGGISAFAVDSNSGRLEFLNQQPTGAGATTFIAVDATGRMAIAANFGAGYVCALPIGPDGRLGARSAFIEHRGPPGPNRDRQAQAHAHSITISPDNRFALACDLGLDRVYVYRIDPAAATLTPNDPPFASAPAGAGPRHGKFSSDGKFFYSSNEMGSSACVYSWDSARGTLDLKQTISALPADFRGSSIAAEIRIHPNGRFVYVSNRGHDSIAVFARDPAAGTLRLVEIVPCGGKHPRNFALSPDGRWLLCANRDTDNVALFRVDSESGRLEKTGVEVAVPHPVCVLFCD